MRDNYIVEKADMALSDLTSGGLLVTDQADRFIRTLQEQPTILKEARVVTMKSPKQEINKVKFASRILRAASQNPAETTIADGRYVKAADRAKTTQDKVTLDTKEVIAEIWLPYEVLEDNIERENFKETLLALIGARVSLDMEEWIINANTGSGDAFLALNNGILAQSTSNVVDALGDPMDANIVARVLKAHPKAFRSSTGLKLYTTSNAEIDTRTAIASRNTGLGDQMLSTNTPITIHGKPVEGVHKMPDGNAFYTDPKNIIVGMHRNISLEMDRDIRARQFIFVVTARVDVKLEEETAVVKVVNLAA